MFNTKTASNPKVAISRVFVKVSPAFGQRIFRQTTASWNPRQPPRKKLLASRKKKKLLCSTCSATNGAMACCFSSLGNAINAALSTQSSGPNVIKSSCNRETLVKKSDRVLADHYDWAEQLVGEILVASVLVAGTSCPTHTDHGPLVRKRT